MLLKKDGLETQIPTSALLGAPKNNLGEVEEGVRAIKICLGFS